MRIWCSTIEIIWRHWYSFKARIFLIQSWQKKQQRHCEIGLKLKIKTNNVFNWCLYSYLWICLTFSSSISIIDFQQVNIGKWLFSLLSSCHSPLMKLIVTWWGSFQTKRFQRSVWTRQVQLSAPVTTFRLNGSSLLLYLYLIQCWLDKIRKVFSSKSNLSLCSVGSSIMP